MAGPRPESTVPGVISHYRLRKLLGGGGMGEVYKATDRRDRSTVAVKLLYPHLASDQAFRERFEREAHVGALLRSPYTVHLLDYGFSNGRYFIAMEYVEGKSLREAIESGPMEIRRALRIAAQVARALEEAEARGVVHRDIKPENIMLGSGDSVKVADFGIAKQIGAGTVTMPGAFVGTLAYAAPELALGKADHRSDIYSLGGTLYHVLTGRPPYRGDILEMLRHHAETPLPLEPLAVLPEAVVEVIKRCLEKDPEQRYQSASALAGALEHAAASAPPSEAEAATVVEAKPSEEGAAVSPEQQEAPTQVAEPQPTGQTELAPTEAQAPEKPAAAVAGPIILALGPPRTGGPFGARLAATSYELTLRNGGSGQAELRLEAKDSDGGCVFSLPGSVSVPPNGAKTVSLRVRPRERRWRGPRETHNFTVTASEGGGGPPAAVSGQFEELPYGWLPFGGLFACGAVGAVAAALFVFSGGGGGGSDAGGSISHDDLSRMVLPQEELGPEYAGFTLDPSASGSLPNEELTADSCDEEQETSDIQRFGRVSGYNASYQSSEQAAAGTGTFMVASRVDQYKDATGAGQGLQEFLDDPVQGLGRPQCEEIITLRREDFAPGAIGDESHGVEVRVSETEEDGEKVEYTLTIVGFVRGAQAGTVMIGHFDSPDYRDDAEGLARKQDKRIRDVLGGEATPRPKPSPSGSGSPSPSASGSGSPTPAGTGSPTPGRTAPPGTAGQPGTAPPPSPPPAPPPPPTAPTISSLGCGPGTVQTGQTVSCNPSISGTVTSRSWSAAGGSPSSGSDGTFSTSYSSAGAKSITLTACNGSACSSQSQTISVGTPPPAAPTISSLGCSPSAVQTGQTVSCNPAVSGAVTSWSWSAPGGSPSSGSGSSFSTSYGSAGGQTITLTACNGSACNSASQPISVTAPPQERYTVYIDSASVPPDEYYVTVNLWVDAPAGGLGFFDIDVEYDGSLLEFSSCWFEGECSSIDANTVNFLGYVGDSGTIYIGSITLYAPYVGESPLHLVVYELSDLADSDVTGLADVYDGAITVE